MRLAHGDCYGVDGVRSGNSEPLPSRAVDSASAKGRVYNTFQRPFARECSDSDNAERLGLLQFKAPPLDVFGSADLDDVRNNAV